jgi:hypothetical protein
MFLSKYSLDINYSNYTKFLTQYFPDFFVAEHSLWLRKTTSWWSQDLASDNYKMPRHRLAFVKSLLKTIRKKIFSFFIYNFFTNVYAVSDLMIYYIFGIILSTI